MNKKMTVTEYKTLMNNQNPDRRAAHKLCIPTSLDPNPTPASSDLRASAGVASQRNAALMAVARQYNLRRVVKGNPGFAWDIAAAKKLVE